MPPSPRLSALNTNARYLTETIRISDQKISDNTPSTFAGVGAIVWGPKQSFSAYRGLVPMSP